jgi:murein L,D-transpeptidase YafK
LNRRPLVRILLATAATAAAIALAGCDTDSGGVLSKSSLRARAPLSDKMIAEIASKNMVKETPILVRIFKEEAELEVWKQTREGRYELLKTYPICRWSGELGPKVREGDRQAPEGFYDITPGQMNPNSNYYLAFNTGFPNAFDRSLGRTGSELMVHGDCSSRGCYAMTDEQIGEIYALARESFFGGQRSFQLQAYPFRMTALNMARHRNNPNMPFWKMLKVGYDHFAVTHLQPKVDVCEKHYVFDAQTPSGSSTPINFSPAGKCPVYEVPADIRAAVADKEQQDATQFAELVSHGTPTVPVRTGTDGGMNPVYLAALTQRQQADAGRDYQAPTPTAAGTIPALVNPPHAEQAVYTVDASPVMKSAPIARAAPVLASVKSTSAKPAATKLASTQSAPEAAPAQRTASSGGGFFDRLTRAIGFEDSDVAKANADGTMAAKPMPHARAVAVAARSRPKAQPHLASAPAKSAHAPAATVASKPVLRGTTTATASESRPPVALATPPRPSLPSNATAMAASPVAPIRGAQPVLSTGSFDNRWSAMR